MIETIFKGGVLTETIYLLIQLLEYISKEFNINPNYLISLVGGIIFYIIFDFLKHDKK